ncbi:MAG: hypothetical protein Q9214_007811 [Letrouitia sp. 1 TL-2023]
MYNLMQQQDSGVNRSIALDSKKVAEASRSDSSSMKTIAALTMFFLPGTAIAVIRLLFHNFMLSPSLIHSLTATCIWLD